jgi:hypothetical protein
MGPSLGSIKTGSPASSFRKAPRIAAPRSWHRLRIFGQAVILAVLGNTHDLDTRSVLQLVEAPHRRACRSKEPARKLPIHNANPR